MNKFSHLIYYLDQYPYMYFDYYAVNLCIREVKTSNRRKKLWAKGKHILHHTYQGPETGSNSPATRPPPSYTLGRDIELMAGLRVAPPPYTASSFPLSPPSPWRMQPAIGSLGCYEARGYRCYSPSISMAASPGLDFPLLSSQDRWHTCS